MTLAMAHVLEGIAPLGSTLGHTGFRPTPVGNVPRATAKCWPQAGPGTGLRSGAVRNWPVEDARRACSWAVRLIVPSVARRFWPRFWPHVVAVNGKRPDPGPGGYPAVSLKEAHHKYDVHPAQALNATRFAPC